MFHSMIALVKHKPSIFLDEDDLCGEKDFFEFNFEAIEALVQYVER